MSSTSGTSKAIFFHETGGPEVLRWEDHDPGAPGPGEALVRHGAVGLNFIDVYHRTGLYPLPSLPAIPGMEGAGTVEAVGEGVTEVRPGDRVAYAGNPVGAYAEHRLIPAHRLVVLPDDIDFVTAAGMMLRGMTARYLLRGCYPVTEGTAMLVHAAAGGVGSLVVPWARHLGATVIGTAGDEAKAERARANGCQHVVLYRQEDVAARVRELTDGRGVDVVYDSVGQATFMASLDCLRPMGTLVSFGQSSGSVEPFNPGLLAAKGSLFLTRPSLMHYTAQRPDLLAHARDLFDVVRAGIVQVQVNQTFPLAQAADAHRALESRRTTGSTVLLV
ncbi:quinone oxidoreductase family protein [Nitratidesulfovibrio sp. 1201_IL3209]|jgi:NADPH2:quinone reductase|uniref:quinone oxidoreductase family protein n=1 Tax=Nitratidesulfovibrio sp. 1201_IL3209 TaxID=3084053 RepID=UPI002FD9C495